MDQLKEMGFVDDEHNTNPLRHSNGNVARAVDFLVDDTDRNVKPKFASHHHRDGRRRSSRQQVANAAVAPWKANNGAAMDDRKPAAKSLRVY